MGIKKEIPTVLSLFFVMIFIFVIFSFKSSEAKVYVDPTEKTAYLYDTFTINVNVTDVMLLQAYDIKLYYHTIPVEGLSVELPPGHFLEPIYNPANLVITHKEIDDNYNATHGRVWVSIKLLTENPYYFRPPRCLLQNLRARSRPGRTGSGVLFTITFNCTGVGTSVLNLYESQLIDGESSPISRIRIHGSINVHR